MPNKFRIIMMLVASILLSVSLVFSQDDFKVKALEGIKRAQKEYASRSSNEKKSE